MANADRLIAIFHEALACPAGAARAAFLSKACQGDAQLEARLVSLLRSHERAGAFLNSTSARDPRTGEDQPGTMVGAYKLVAKIGEGGWGVVYEAEQTAPVRRRVALKVIKLGMDTMQVIARFEAERQALAMMDHPNIARVLEAGSTETGRPFFIMELVHGVRLTDYCDQHQLSTWQRLDLFIQVCQAVQHAHQKGVIHRDLKPSNILVTLQNAAPVPKVIDFGIAKATEGRLTDAPPYTQLLHFVGTPAYMSPEQANMNGLDLDTRSDIYSLGALLYELLTGATPFDGDQLLIAGIDAMRKTIRDVEPPRPSTRVTQELATAMARRNSGEESALVSQQLQQKIHILKGDLDWIVMKCLEKDRARRYQTASGLAADLNRHLTNEPVLARPPSAAYIFQKAWRRNKVAFASAGTALSVLLLALVTVSWLAIRATKAEKTALQAKEAERIQTKAAQAQLERAVRAEAEIRRNAYAAEINVAFQSIAHNDLEKARELLNRQRPKGQEPDLRGFEWRYLWLLCQGDAFPLPGEGADAAAAWSPDGKLIAYSGQKIIIRDAATLNVVATLPEPAQTLSFDPAGNLLASGSSGNVTLWDTRKWERLRSMPEALAPALFSPDGSWLLTGNVGGFLLWDTQTWKPVEVCQDAPILRWQARNAVAFSPDSQCLLTTSGTGLEVGDHLRVWRLPELEELPELRFDSEPGSMAFTLDGKQLIIGLWDGQIVAVDWATRTHQRLRPEHAAWVTAVVFSPDGKTFATASTDQSVSIWDTATLLHLARLRDFGRIYAMAMSRDGQTLLTTGPNQTVSLWPTKTRHQFPELKGHGLMAGFSSNGNTVVACGTNGWRLWSPQSGEAAGFPKSPFPPISNWGKACDVSSNQSTAAVGRLDGTVELWDLRQGARMTNWVAHEHSVSTVSFSPSGNTLATAPTNGRVKIWDLASQRAIECERHDCEFFSLAFSPDGTMLAGCGPNRDVWLWDTATGHELLRLSGHHGVVGAVAFSPDGTLLITSSYDGQVHLWELPSGRELPSLKGHVIAVVGAAFCPDGKTLATGDMSGKVKLWNVATRQEMTTIALADRFPILSFSPDQNMLVASERPQTRGRIQALRVPSFEEIAAAESGHPQNPKGF